MHVFCLRIMKDKNDDNIKTISIATCPELDQYKMYYCRSYCY